MHRDKLRSRIPTKAYKDQHEKIFGAATGAPILTPEQEEARDLSRKAHHAKLAEDGKKPADYYLQHERRVPADPSRYEKKLPLSKSYAKGYDRLYGKQTRK